MKFFRNRKLPKAEWRWTFLSEAGEQLLREKTFELPLSDAAILKMSSRFFDDPDPCFIHRNAVMNRLYYEIEETAGKLPHGEKLFIGSLPEQVIEYMELPEGILYVLLS